MNSLSETSLVAPYKLIGAAALSVLNAITFLPQAKDASITFCAPLIFVLLLHQDYTPLLGLALKLRHE